MRDGSVIRNPSRPSVKCTTEGPVGRGGDGFAAAAGAGSAGATLPLPAVAHPASSARLIANSRKPAIVTMREQLPCSLTFIELFLRDFCIFFPLGTLRNRCSLFQGCFRLRHYCGLFQGCVRLRNRF